MKKVISLLLVVIMLLALCACGRDAKTSPSASPAESKAPVESAAPAESKAPAESAAPEESKAPETTGTIGYYTDDVDHKARETYDFVYFCTQALQMSQTFYTAFQALGEQFNYTIQMMSAENDGEKYITNLETAIVMGVDGMIVDINRDAADRIYEVVTESGIPYVYMGNSYYVDDKCMAPTVAADQYLNGCTQIEWFHEHYKEYWKEDFDESKIVLLDLQFAANPDLIIRANGVLDTFAKYWPGNKIMESDLVARGLSAQSAYDEVAAIFAANPEVERWLIAGTVEDFGQGAARAVEDYEKSDTALIITSGASILPTEWDSGYNGSWIASYAVFCWDYAVPTSCGLIAICDGRATEDSLWADKKDADDIGAYYATSAQLITVDNYKTVERELAASVGVTLP